MSARYGISDALTKKWGILGHSVEVQGQWLFVGFKGLASVSIEATRLLQKLHSDARSFIETIRSRFTTI